MLNSSCEVHFLKPVELRFFYVHIYVKPEILKNIDSILTLIELQNISNPFFNSNKNVSDNINRTNILVFLSENIRQNSLTTWHNQRIGNTSFVHFIFNEYDIQTLDFLMATRSNNVKFDIDLTLEEVLKFIKHISSLENTLDELLNIRYSRVKEIVCQK